MTIFLDVPWCETWYVNLFSFIFVKMKVLEWPMSRSLINGKFELVPWCSLLQTWYVNLFGFVFGKMKVLDWPLSRKWDFGLYAPTTLINGKFELVPWCETWYVNLFGFVFGKMKVLECLLSRKRDFSLYGYNFNKYEGWTRPLI